MKLHKPQALEVIRLANQALLDFGKAAIQLAREMEDPAKMAFVVVRVNPGESKQFNTLKK